MNNNQSHPTELDQQQRSEKQTKLGISMIKEGMASHNETLIRGGIRQLKTAAAINQQAKQCLCRLKAKANPATSKLIVLQDPSQLRFSSVEIAELSGAKVQPQSQQHSEI